MDGKVHFDYSSALPFIRDYELRLMADSVSIAHKAIHNRSSFGNEYLGWLSLPNEYDKKEFSRIKQMAERIQSSSEVLLVIGVGGSYLGSCATIEALNHTFYNLLPNDKRKYPQIYFVGNQLSSSYLHDLLEIIEDKEVSVNVISKSGTTTEPAIAFRIIRNYVEKKYGKEEARKRIYATTDKHKGALKSLAEQEGYESFVIPNSIGGRYSVLTAVGLLPIAVSGINIDDFMQGAKAASKDLSLPDLMKNPAYQYAVVRNLLYRKGNTVEVLATYEPKLKMLSEWWKQLFGESEGKDGKGLFPVSVSFTTDLHSLGQYLQDGRRNLFETVIRVKKIEERIMIKKEESDLDELNYLAGQRLDFVNHKALEATMNAHRTGGIPNLLITIPELNAYHFGYVLYFFQKACAMSGYISGVNPFDQPGVEAYKQNMFALLGKPGYGKDG